MNTKIALAPISDSEKPAGKELTLPMPDQSRWAMGTETLRYLLIGALFGFIFPVVATLIRIQTLALPPGIAGAIEVQRSDPLLWIIDTAPFFLGAFAAFAGYRQDVVRRSNQELNQSKTALQAISNELEQRVEDRTRELASQSQQLVIQAREAEEANLRTARRIAQLQALSQVISSIVSIQDLDELLPRITEVISHQFGFYHVGIFLIDQAGDYAVLSAANSLGGRRMLARGHRLKVGEVGIVGYVTGKSRPRVALDTGADSVFFNNPDLPDTRSEMALPLKIGGVVIGALDVQSSEANAFDEQDVEIISTLADQVSIAIQNARAYTETQRALAESESAYRGYVKREWHRHSREHKVRGYRFRAGRSAPLDETATGPEIQKAVITGKLSVGRETDGATVMAVPIKLREQVIAVLNVRSDQGHELTPDDLEMVQAIADRVALAAENARLLEETSGRAERERTVAEITNKIRATNDPQAMIETAMRELKDALGASHVDILPTNGNSGTNEVGD